MKPREKAMLTGFLLLVVLFAGISWRQRTRYPESTTRTPEQKGGIDVLLIDPQSKTSKLSIDLKEGKIRRFEPESYGLHLPPGASIDRCLGKFAPPVQSPDARMFVTCRGPGLNHPDTLVISSGTNPKYDWTSPPRTRIVGYGWSPDSRSVAALVTTEHFDASVEGLLTLILGHPLSRNDYDVYVFEISRSSPTKIEVAKEVPSSLGGIVWHD